MQTLTKDEYAALVGRLADDAMLSWKEMLEIGQADDFILDVVDENTFEELVGFGSPLDVGLRGGNEDTYALSVLIRSENRHVAVTSERNRRLACDSRKGMGALFVGEDCIDYRFLAACALHADVMEAVASRIRVYVEEDARQARFGQAVPFE
jgi:hypothetical protein